MDVFIEGACDDAFSPAIYQAATVIRGTVLSRRHDAVTEVRGRLGHALGAFPFLLVAAGGVIGARGPGRPAAGLAARPADPGVVAADLPSHVPAAALVTMNSALAWLCRVFGFTEAKRFDRGGDNLTARLRGPDGGAVMISGSEDDFKAWTRERAPHFEEAAGRAALDPEGHQWEFATVTNRSPEA
jgi:hypothetical protein